MAAIEKFLTPTLIIDAVTNDRPRFERGEFPLACDMKTAIARTGCRNKKEIPAFVVDIVDGGVGWLLFLPQHRRFECNPRSKLIKKILGLKNIRICLQRLD
jgi:hypothetical protein